MLRNGSRQLSACICPQNRNGNNVILFSSFSAIIHGIWVSTSWAPGYCLQYKPSSVPTHSLPESPVLKLCSWNTLYPQGFTVTEGLTLEGTSGGHLVQSSYSSRAAQSWIPRTVSRCLWKISKVRKSTVFLGNLSQCSVTLRVKKFFSDVQREPPVFQFAPIASGPITGHHWKQPAPSSLHSPSRYLYTLMWPYWAFSSPAWTVPAF